MHHQECIIDEETDFCPALYLIADDKAWKNNDEFARQFLAGLNPVVIELVQVITRISLPESAMCSVLMDRSKPQIVVHEHVCSKTNSAEVCIRFD
jgi:hypothetical protein